MLTQFDDFKRDDCNCPISNFPFPTLIYPLLHRSRSFPYLSYDVSLVHVHTTQTLYVGVCLYTKLINQNYNKERIKLTRSPSIIGWLIRVFFFYFLATCSRGFRSSLETSKVVSFVVLVIVPYPRLWHNFTECELVWRVMYALQKTLTLSINPVSFRLELMRFHHFLCNTLMCLSLIAYLSHNNDQTTCLQEKVLS